MSKPTTEIRELDKRKAVKPEDKPLAILPKGENANQQIITERRDITTKLTEIKRILRNKQLYGTK